MTRTSLRAALLSSFLFAGVAHADQCQAVAPEQQKKALELLKPGVRLFDYCGPCNNPGVLEGPYVLKFVKAEGSTLTVNGKGVDLAYLYIWDAESETYVNVARLVGCPTEGVSRSLMLTDEMQLVVLPDSTFTEIAVDSASDDYTESGLTMESGDLLAILARGQVKTGAWNGTTPDPRGHFAANCSAPEGSETDGALLYKVGNAAWLRTGTTAVVDSQQAGMLKFKVRDTKYSDNAGKYTVGVFRVPSRALASDARVEVEAANDEWVSSGIEVSAGDIVLIRASGEAVVQGKRTGPLGITCVNGNTVTLEADGALAAKIGTSTVVRVGASWILTATASGPLKFRVRSGSKYEGNTGSYSVRATLLKGAAKK